MAGIFHLAPSLVTPTIPPRTVGIEDLMRFAPLRSLDDEAQAEVLAMARRETYSDRECLFQLSDSDRCEYFLLSGELVLMAADGRQHAVTADSTVAQQPLARLRPRHYRAVVKSRATVLVVDSDLLTELQLRMQKRVQLRYGVEEIQSNELAPESEELLLFRSFKEDFRQYRVHLPVLPPAVAEIRKLVRLGCSDSAELARIAVSMPALERFLIHAANSSLMRPKEPCHHCITAIERMGPAILADLALVFSAYLHRSNGDADENENLWSFSLGVAAYGWWLAERTGLADPVKAMVLGVLHNVGFFIAKKYIQSVASQELVPSNERSHRILLSLLSRDVTFLQLGLWDIDEVYIQSLAVIYDWQKSGKSQQPDLADVLQTAVYLQSTVEASAQSVSLPKPEQVAGLVRVCLFEQQLMNARAIRPDVIKVFGRIQRLFA